MTSRKLSAIALIATILADSFVAREKKERVYVFMYCKFTFYSYSICIIQPTLGR